MNQKGNAGGRDSFQIVSHKECNIQGHPVLKDLYTNIPFRGLAYKLNLEFFT